MRNGPPDGMHTYRLIIDAELWYRNDGIGIPLDVEYPDCAALDIASKILRKWVGGYKNKDLKKRARQCEVRLFRQTYGDPPWRMIAYIPIPFSEDRCWGYRDWCKPFEIQLYEHDHQGRKEYQLNRAGYEN